MWVWGEHFKENFHSTVTQDSSPEHQNCSATAKSIAVTSPLPAAGWAAWPAKQACAQHNPWPLHQESTVQTMSLTLLLQIDQNSLTVKQDLNRCEATSGLPHLKQSAQSDMSVWKKSWSPKLRRPQERQYKHWISSRNLGNSEFGNISGPKNFKWGFRAFLTCEWGPHQLLLVYQKPWSENFLKCRTLYYKEMFQTLGNAYQMNKWKTIFSWHTE